MRFLRWVLAALALALMVALGLGYLGRWHPAGDSFAVFRAQGVAALVLVASGALAMGARWPGLGGLVLALVAGGQLVLAYNRADDAGAVTVYQKNMLWRNDDLAALEADIRAVAPDVLTLQEVSQPNRALLAALADVLPVQVYCPFRRVGGTAVATRWPMVPGTETCAPGLAALQAEGPEGRVWLVSIHLHWPWPYVQASHVQLILPVLAAMQGPVVVAGDFNMVRWSQALAGVRAAARVENAGPVRGTYPEFGPLLVLPIDHVLAPEGGSLEVRPLLGSDHRGLVGRVGL